MKHFFVSDRADKVVTDNLTPTCRSCMNDCQSKGQLIDACPLYGHKRRLGKVQNKKGLSFLCCDVTKTTKLFRDKLEALSYAYPELTFDKTNTITDQQKKINRLLHNLTTINAHNIQEIYDLVPQDTLARNWNDQIDFLSKYISERPLLAAKTLLQISKNNIHMKSEFSIFKKLDRQEKVDLDKKSHKLQAVVMNVLHPFFADFSKIDCFVSVSNYTGVVEFDYETVQVALYHLFDNASKYTKPESKIYLNFEESQDFVSLILSGPSLYVNQDEREDVMREGVSGKLPIHLEKNGQGIGTWRMKQMMELNGGEFLVSFGNDSHKVKGIPYSKNRFELKFKRKKL